MTTSSVWRPAMYGGFAGAALGELLMIAHWASPHPGLCALQFASILGGGIGGGLVIAYGPIRALARVLGVNRRDATWKVPVKRIAFLLIVTGLGAALFAAAWKPGARLEILMAVWVIVVLMLMAAGPRMCDTPRRHWGGACCDALAAVYGPFLVAAVNTWLFDGHNTWLCVDLWKVLLAAPGVMIMELVSVTIWHHALDFSPATFLVFAGLLSTTAVVVTAWISAKTRWARWGLLPLINSLCALGALLFDAVMRA